MEREQPNQPTCARCGDAMIFNVPRMGASGGFVHASTGQPLCVKNPPVPESGMSAAITDSRNADPEGDQQKIREPKHSAIASLLWQYVDELETRASQYRCQDDQKFIGAYIALIEQSSGLRKVLERNYGPRGTA